MNIEQQGRGNQTEPSVDGQQKGRDAEEGCRGIQKRLTQCSRHRRMCMQRVAPRTRCALGAIKFREAQCPETSAQPQHGIRPHRHAAARSLEATQFSTTWHPPGGCNSPSVNWGGRCAVAAPSSRGISSGSQAASAAVRRGAGPQQVAAACNDIGSRKWQHEWRAHAQQRTPAGAHVGRRPHWQAHTPPDVGRCGPTSGAGRVDKEWHHKRLPTQPHVASPRAGRSRRRRASVNVVTQPRPHAAAACR